MVEPQKQSCRNYYFGQFQSPVSDLIFVPTNKISPVTESAQQYHAYWLNIHYIIPDLQMARNVSSLFLYSLRHNHGLSTACSRAITLSLWISYAMLCSTRGQVSSFVYSSARHRGIRPNLVAMKKIKIQGRNMTLPVVPYRVLKLVRFMSDAQCNQWRHHFPIRNSLDWYFEYRSWPIRQTIQCCYSQFHDKQSPKKLYVHVQVRVQLTRPASLVAWFTTDEYGILRNSDIRVQMNMAM